jgi:hypothetical protein
MTTFNAGDEVCVSRPIRDYKGDWVFPGERLFVVQGATLRSNSIRVRCPASSADMWIQEEDLDALQHAIQAQFPSVQSRLGELESQYQRLVERLEAIEEDLYEDDEPLGIVDEIAGVPGFEVTICDCPRADDNVHERGCVNHPDYQAPVEDEWKANPYSLPPATREGAVCPACSGPTGQSFNGARMLREVRHEDQATVDECVKRQKAMGWKPPITADDGPHGEA